MAISVFKTFSAGEILTAADLNSSFTQITGNGESLGWPATTSKDLNGNALILDVDGDTSITADTDDQIDFSVGATDVWSITATGPQQRKNIVIGGDFHTNPWQRGTSFAAVADDTYTADRFEYQKVGAMVHTVSKSADAPTVAQAGIYTANCLLLDCTTVDSSIAAGDLAGVHYIIEGYDWSRIAQRKFTLSFWHKHTKTGTYCVSFRNSGADRSYVAEYTQSGTDAWEKATVTVSASPSAGTWDYEAGVGVIVNFTAASGTTFHTTADAWQTGDFLSTSNQVNACDNVANNFRLALIQIEEGPTATAFEQRTFSKELALCQRYYQKSYNPGVDPATSTNVGALRTTATGTGTENGVNMPAIFPTTMRTTPTMVIYSTTGASAKIRNLSVAGDLDASSQQTGANGVIILNGAAATDTNVYGAHYTADAEL